MAVVGCSGSGKTTLAATLARTLGVEPRRAGLDLPPAGVDSALRRGVPGPCRRGDGARRWVVDGNYSVVRDVVWDKADTVVWFDLPYVTVMARTIRRTLRRTFTREELWNGNREPLSNLWSSSREVDHRLDRHPPWGVPPALHAKRRTIPRWADLHFVRLALAGRSGRLRPGWRRRGDEGGVTMDLDLAGRAMLITGGTDGLGLALAKRLAAEGASVAVCGRDAERVRVRRGGPARAPAAMPWRCGPTSPDPKTSRRSSTPPWLAGAVSTGSCTTPAAPRVARSSRSTTRRGNPTSNSS